MAVCASLFYHIFLSQMSSHCLQKGTSLKIIHKSAHLMPNYPIYNHVPARLYAEETCNEDFHIWWMFWMGKFWYFCGIKKYYINSMSDILPTWLTYIEDESIPLNSMSLSWKFSISSTIKERKYLVISGVSNWVSRNVRMLHTMWESYRKYIALLLITY